MFAGAVEIKMPVLEVPLRMSPARMSPAIALVGATGLERELKRRPTGLRVNLPVASAAATLALLSAELIGECADATEIIPIDMFRIIDTGIAGVAISGAGGTKRRGRDLSELAMATNRRLSGSIGVVCNGN